VSAGTGMSFTTITSSGAVNADTLVLSTRSWRQKGIDSVSSLIAAKVNISDTATMLSPYAKSAALGLYLPLTGGTLTGGLTGTTGAFTSSGGGNTFNITHSSGSGIALNISKGGNGEGLYLNKTSGTGNAATIIGTLNATTLVKSGGTSTQYLMADGTTSTLTNPVTGTGTTNYVSKWNGTTTQTNSVLYDDGEVKVNTTADGGNYVLQTNGNLYVRGGANTDGGILGAEFLDTTLFTTTGWTGFFATGYTHTTGNTTALTNSKASVVNTLYHIVYTVANRTAGTFTISFGGYTSGNLSATGAVSPKATTTGSLAITPTSDFNGRIIISIKAISSGDAFVQFATNSTAQNMAEIRGDFSKTNLFFGNSSGRYVTTGSGNIGAGSSNLTELTSGSNNTAIGRASLSTLTIGSSNIGIGFGAGQGIVSGSDNVAIGSSSLSSATGSSNVGIGSGALQSITTGENNTSIGTLAGRFISGFGANQTSSNSTYLGYLTMASANGNTNENVFGNSAIGNGSNTTTIGNTSITATYVPAGNFMVGTTTNAGYRADIAGTLRSTLGAQFATTSGNMGVGTVAPAVSANFTTLEVKGRVATNGGNLVLSTSDNTRLGNFYVDENGLTLGAATNHWLRFITNNTPQAIITNSGNFGIGNTAPSEKLHVTGRIRATTIDSTGTGTAMNMLYSDATGVIKKAAVPSGGSGTVTSVATGFGLSGGTITTTGTLLVDSASVATRERVQKGIDSVAAISVKGTGISGYFPKWTGTGTQDTSQLFQLGANIGIGTASPTYRLHLPDAGATANQAMIAGTIFGSDGNGITISPNSSNITIKGGQGNGSIYSGTISSVARWGINTTSISDAVLSINGDVKIVTIDSTATAVNMLYQDANGIIKKSAVPTGLTMADDVITASGSWVATKDAGSGTTINNVAYTTNGTTKMVTADANFYIAETGWTDGTWITIGTIPTDYRPKKTINWNSDFIVSGAEYERSDNTDFTGACDISGQMRIKDDGTVEIIATMSTNSIAAGGTAYIIVPFQVSYIVK
jgi:hypothetical protein